MWYCSFNFRSDLHVRVRQERESAVDSRVMNIITSAQSFKNRAIFLPDLAKSCTKLGKIHMLQILSILALNYLA